MEFLDDVNEMLADAMENRVVLDLMSIEDGSTRGVGTENFSRAFLRPTSCGRCTRLAARSTPPSLARCRWPSAGSSAMKERPPDDPVMAGADAERYMGNMVIGVEGLAVRSSLEQAAGRRGCGNGGEAQGG